MHRSLSAHLPAAGTQRVMGSSLAPVASGWGPGRAPDSGLSLALGSKAPVQCREGMGAPPPSDSRDKQKDPRDGRLDGQTDTSSTSNLGGGCQAKTGARAPQGSPPSDSRQPSTLP